MAIDKKIDYVEQDGSLNFVKNSESVTVPKKFKARKEAPAVKLAYITDAEAKMLKKQKPGTPHKGPKGIPSYDSFGSIDASGQDTGVSGSQTSAAETGGSGSGMSSQDRDDFRSAAIAAGAGQRVNPGFFDDRNTVSRAELHRAKNFDPKAFRSTRGGISNFIQGGGLLGSLVSGIGRLFGLGKRFNQPYDRPEFAPGFATNTMTMQNDLGNEGLLSLLENEEEETDKSLGKIIMEARANNSLRRNPDYDYLGPNLNEGIFMDYQELDESGSGKVNTTDKFIVPFEGARTIIRNPNYIEPGGTVLADEFPSTRKPEMRDLGNPYADPRIVPEEFGLEPGPTPFTLDDRRREEGPKLGIGSDFDRDLENYLSQAGNQGIMQLAEVKPNTLKQLKRMGIFKEGQKSPYTDKDELKMMVPGLENATDEELDQILAGTFTV